MATVDRITLEAWNGSAYADLTDLVNWNAQSITGLGVPRVTNLTQRGPSQNGATYLGFRYQERVIQMVLDGLGDDEATMHDRRAALAQLFGPSNTLMQLRYSVPPDKQYQFDAYVSIPPDFTTSGRVGYRQQTVVELRCPDPTAYDPTGIGVGFSISGGGTGWTLNSNWALTATGWTFGTSSLNQTQVVSMNAINAAESFPVITMIGPITNPKIVNGATGIVLDFNGYSIGSGTAWVIDTRYASKSVMEGTTSQAYKLSEDSSITTFSLIPGDNPLTVTGTSISAVTQVSVQYYNRFTGV